MKTAIYKSGSRGHANYGWLDTNYSFSFANYYNPERVHFGNLRVLNDDIVQAGSGFGNHPHDNMEIITIPLSGKLTHKDSMGHEQEIGVDEVQVMSAGTGIFHSEYNNSETDTNILQLWILPKLKNVKPTYNQALFPIEEAHNKWQFLVNDNNSPLTINQEARVSRIKLSKGMEVSYELRKGSHGSFLFLIEGKISIGSLNLEKRDAVEITETQQINIKAIEDSFLLNIEV
jgi:quercetin 2,3-dioxygenase